MDEYLLFADETKSTTENPNFCFAGMSVSRKYYEDELTKKVNLLKKKHFEDTDIILHFSEMKKNINKFSVLRDITKRDSFWRDYVQLINDIPMEIFGVYFDESKMKELFKGSPFGNYDMSFNALLDNYMHYLKDRNARGQICIESRTLKENGDLQKTFYNYISNGSLCFSPKDASNHLTSLGFTIKGDNCVGLQIADAIPSQLLRYKRSCTKDSYNLSKTLSKKIYKFNTIYEPILGLKNIL